MKEAGADTSNVETDKSSRSDVSSPVPMDIDQNPSIDSIEAPLSLINDEISDNFSFFFFADSITPDILFFLHYLQYFWLLTR